MQELLDELRASPAIKDARRSFDKPDRKQPELLRRQLIGELVRLGQLAKEGARIASLAKTEASAWGPAWAEALQARGMDPWYARQFAGPVGDYVRRLNVPPQPEEQPSPPLTMNFPPEPRYRAGLDNRSWPKLVRRWAESARRAGSLILRERIKLRKRALLAPSLIPGFQPEGPPRRSRASVDVNWRVTLTAAYLLGLPTRKDRAATIRDELEGVAERANGSRAVRTILERVGLERPRKREAKRG